MGAATFALISDIASRSGSSAASWSSSSCGVRPWSFSVIGVLPASRGGGGRRALLPVVLGDRRGLLRVRVCDRVVGERIECNSRIHGRGDIGVDQRHRLAVRKLRHVLVCELFGRQALLFFPHALVLLLCEVCNGATARPRSQGHAA